MVRHNIKTRTISVLSLDTGADDQDSLRDIFTRSTWALCPGSEWRLRSIGSVESAMTELQRRQCPILLCEAQARWRTMLTHVQQLPHPPLLIVTSRLADDRLWAEALNLGAHDVLAKPFDSTEVVRVMSLAWLRWREQHGQPAAPRKEAAGSGSSTGGFGVGGSGQFYYRAGAV